MVQKGVSLGSLASTVVLHNMLTASKRFYTPGGPQGIYIYIYIYIYYVYYSVRSLLHVARFLALAFSI